ncbi:MAG TPA: peptidase M4 [Candidatus Competibacteraceae bacterium]|nr:peptidase M4 [Candidatus Competibacteraceae bacterium]HRZ06359.1 peptidase M4 [Candidatus Competibacteraceae bacterium]HSA46930.1 peptidase M4 [Candidatus Competibacteraceae bacterium]
MRHSLPLAAALLLAAGLSGSATAGRDHDEIRRLRSAGKILSLETIIAQHRREDPSGQLLDAELELEKGRYLYELKFLGDDGVVRKFEYDASTGELWHVERKEEKE